MTIVPDKSGSPAKARENPSQADLESARAGDRDAMESLVRATSREAYGFTYRLTCNHADAEDVLQESYVKALRALDSFRGESSFKTWLFRIIHNTFLNQARALGRAEAAMEGSLDVRTANRPASPSDGAELREAREILNAHIAELPARQREALVLHAHHGMSYDEIAQVMETTRENVKTSICLARKKLRESLGDR